MEKSRESLGEQSKKDWWDTLGIFVSGLCVIHCLLVPVALVLFPSVGAVLIRDESVTHKLLFALVLGLAVLAFVVGYRVHQSLRPIRWMAAGLVLVVIGTFWSHDWLGHASEYVIVPIGGLILMRAHFLNRAHCRACQEHHSCPGEKLAGTGH